ncbi:MAG: RimK family protein [Nitrosomonadales bacterium]|nr:RimK family protein [Nitrosomonadales bacterium]
MRSGNLKDDLVIVSDLLDWPQDIPGLAVVRAQDFLTDPAFGVNSAGRVFNLCRSCRYQSLGYYVSLLAEARGQQPFPRLATIADLRSSTQADWLNGCLGDTVQRELAPLRKGQFELEVYFGHSEAKRYGKLALQLFNLLKIPLMRVRFERRAGEWRLADVLPPAIDGMTQRRRDLLGKAATEFFTARKPAHQPRAPRCHLAILHDPGNPEPPSNREAMRKFAIAAEALGMRVHLITRADFSRLGEFDALFIRDTTFANHYTYRFSRQAQAQGLVVIDDPDSILKCNNKVYLAALFARHHLPAPKTLLVHKGNIGRIASGLALPCVLKQPDSSFSLGVVKVDTREQLRGKACELLEKSELIIAQEYLPTEFDWRVVILDRRILCVAKYYMAPGYWQIIKHDERGGAYVEGPAVAVPETGAPGEMLRLALQAANLIGDGFYGVDIKQVGGRFYFIEVNDNPNIDAGNEDALLKGALYREVMQVFLTRIRARKVSR